MRKIINLILIFSALILGAQIVRWAIVTHHEALKRQYKTGITSNGDDISSGFGYYRRKYGLEEPK